MARYKDVGGRALLLAFASSLAVLSSTFGLGQVQYVETLQRPGSFGIAEGGVAASVYVDPNDYPGVLRAAKNLQADIARVTSLAPAVLYDEKGLPARTIIIGTIGKSRLIDRLIQDGKIVAKPVAGTWESFVIQVVPAPLPGVSNGLVIAGSDKRGTIYGVYDLSEQIGVSPWYWWADVPAKHRDTLFVKSGRYVQGPPAVKYRGIFLNDEAPSLTGWVNEKFGGYNHAFYTNVFELLLRLKANSLWPAMWNNSFNSDDPLNPKLADEYGIIMGTSHHEPMMRAWKEWERAGHGKGTWDYTRSAESLRAFWREGLARTCDCEKIITLAMRGDGDEPMSETESIGLLERIVADQRSIIAESLSTNLAAVPQAWALYKEVQGYYEKGMRVPDDVTLLWCDDNWGNVRRLPVPEERKRSGGAGVYYHFDYVGGPRNYKWLNTVPITKVWEQMNLAHEYGADRIWIVNVGDLKPMEFPIEFFLNLAWDPARWTKEQIPEYTRLWAEREFGREYAADIAEIISKYTKYNGWRKPELLEPTTFHLVNYREADAVLAGWETIVNKAERIHRRLPESARDAFFELVLYPARASAQVAGLYIAAGRNQLYVSQGRAGANDLATQTRALFQADADLSAFYNHSLAQGKWNHMMDQTHIGYTGWQQPASNAMPTVTEIQLPAAAEMGVAIEGSASAWPGAAEDPVLPGFDAFNRQERCIDVFNRGRASFEFMAEASVPWIVVSTNGEARGGFRQKSATISGGLTTAATGRSTDPTPALNGAEAAHGTVEKEQRLWVNVDWQKAPKGSSTGTVRITRPGTNTVAVRVNVFNPIEPTRDSLKGFVEADGTVSIEAEHYTRKTDAGPVRWERIEDYGRTLSSMTVFPVTVPSVTPPTNSPCLEYQMYLFSTGRVDVVSIVAPSLNFVPGRGLRFAISFDDEAPQVMTAVPKGFFVDNGNRDWEASVRDNCRQVKSTHRLQKPGYHTLKFWMVDPGVVLQKLVVDLGGVKPSYFGPPESFH
jgi:hypothetical protein